MARRPLLVISDRQREALDALRQFGATRGYQPTLRELGGILGISESAAYRLIVQLERKGYVKRQGVRAMTILEPKAEE